MSIVSATTELSGHRVQGSPLLGLVPAEVARDRDSGVAVAIAVAGLKIEAGVPLSEEQAEVGAEFFL